MTATAKAATLTRSGKRAPAANPLPPIVVRYPSGELERDADENALGSERANTDSSPTDRDGGRAIGRRGGHRAIAAGHERGLFEEVEQPGGELEFFGDAAHDEPVTHGDRAELHRGIRLI